MTEETIYNEPAPKRGVSTTTQIIIWGAVIALLVLVGFGLKRAQNPMITIDSEVPDFPLTMFEDIPTREKLRSILPTCEEK